MARFDMLAPDVRANPYPHYARLRREAPITQIEPGRIWAVSRFDDVAAALEDTARYSSAGLQPLISRPWLAHNPMADSMLFLDPPEHGRIRALVAGAFGSRVIPRIEPLARRVCADFARRAQSGAGIDVCQTLSAELPAAVIATLLGLDPGLGPQLRVWSEAIAAVSPGTPSAMYAHIRQCVAEMDGHVREALSARGRARQNDLMSDLMDAEIHGQQLTEAQLVGFVFLLLIAGFETTAHVLTNALRILAERPALIARLKDEPAAIPRFVDEVLRFDASVQGTVRLTRAQVEVAGTRLPAGSMVLLLLASANRDERQFSDPETFDIDRPNHASMAFGHGIHCCLGAALARAEVRMALEELLPSIDRIQVLEGPVWNQSLTVRGATSCTMAFSAARNRGGVRPEKHGGQ